MVLKNDFFKHVNTFVIGKTIENIRSRINARLIANEMSAKTLVAKPHYERTTIFDKNLVAVPMSKTGILGAVPPNFLRFPHNFVVPRKTCFTHITKTKIFFPKMYFPQTLKPGIGL